MKSQITVRSHQYFPVLLGGLLFLGLCSEALGSTNVAHISQGGNVSSFSSILTGGVPNDVIGGTASCYPTYCESGTFIFNRGDSDQWFIIRLAHAYPLHEITSLQSGGSGDREVWDLLEILTRNGSGPWVSWGYLPGDYNIPATVSFTMDPPIIATEIKCRYGRYSPDFGGGSRVHEVSAYTDEPSYPAFEILSATFDKSEYQGGGELAHLTVVTKSNWGSSQHLHLATDLTPRIGSAVHMGDDSFALQPGGQHVTVMDWTVPADDHANEYAAQIALDDGSTTVAGKLLDPAFTATALDQHIIDLYQNDLQICWFDSNSDCIFYLLDMVPYASTGSHALKFVERMCEAGALRRDTHLGESAAVARLAFLEYCKTGLSIYGPGLGEFYQFYKMIALFSTAGKFARECEETDLGGGNREGLHRGAPEGQLVDSLAVWVRTATDSSTVEVADALFVEGSCGVVVEADSSWANADSTGLNAVEIADADTVGLVAVTTKGLHRLIHEEGGNPRSAARFVVDSRRDQALNVGLLHRTMADTLAFVRYPEFAVTDSSVVTVVVADSISVPVLEVDLDGDGTVDFVWYPGAASVEGGASLPGRGEPTLSLASVPNPTAGASALVLRSAVSLKAVEVSVFDVVGREVRKLAVGDLTPGVHQVAWDGRADDGRQVASGVYYCVGSYSGGGSTAKRLVVLR